jgi:hypothetical protein
MKKVFLNVVLILLVLLKCVWAQQGPSKDSYAELIVGEWTIAPHKGVTSGTIVFSKNGAHATEEKHSDGTGVGRKGEYQLDTSKSPVRIQICTGKCGVPGSEWTTLFGIVQFYSNDKMEIRTSPDSNYPRDFSQNKTDEYTMILTRKK